MLFYVLKGQIHTPMDSGIVSSYGKHGLCLVFMSLSFVSWNVFIVVSIESSRSQYQGSLVFGKKI